MTVWCQIKVKDQQDVAFNFYTDIDVTDFELMKNNQNLDINYREFKDDLIEMLQQHQNHEMQLKIEIMNNLNKCNLVFYGKTKIKVMIYLIIELKETNSKEIFQEMNNNLKMYQEQIENLNRKLSMWTTKSKEQESLVQNAIDDKKKLQETIYQYLNSLDGSVQKKLQNLNRMVLEKVSKLDKKLNKLLMDVNAVKNETNLKIDSNQRLLKTMESLRLETIDSASIINDLKKENCALLANKYQQEKYITELNKKNDDLNDTIVNLQTKNDQLLNDLEKISVVITQKKSANDELTKDLHQANHMLMTFNKHYDAKVKEIQDLTEILSEKDQAMNETRLKINKLVEEFEEYKSQYNREGLMLLKHQVKMQDEKIAKLELNLRQVNKMNNILTQKLNEDMLRPQ
ncbi:protein hook homolog isoform X2 [Aethina tumida]|uniref:protein hook homolog isoform X2 n=1 Tax=Aethina tumida TaxID=116153 RepID=UPI0021498136|nr:protein hook homolog isoform X2 [Aethina tumida]